MPLQLVAPYTRTSSALIRFGRPNLGTDSAPPAAPDPTPGGETATVEGALAFGGFELMIDEPSADTTGTGIVRAKPTKVHSTTNYVCAKNGERVVDLIINGTVDTAGFDDIFIENCEIRGTTLTSGAGMVVKTGESQRVRIQFCEVYSATGYGGAMGIGVGNFTSLRNDLHHLSDAHRVSPVGTSGSAPQDTPWAAIIEGCYVHDTIMDTPDPAQTRTDNKTHSDALVQIESGTNIRIRGNRATGLHSTDGTSSVTHVVQDGSEYDAVPAGTTGARAYAVCTSAVMMSPNAANTPLRNVQIVSNWLGGGEVSINGAEDLDATSRITGNVFDKNSFSGTAIWQKAAMAAGVLGTNKYRDGSAA